MASASMGCNGLLIVLRQYGYLFRLPGLGRHGTHVSGVRTPLEQLHSKWPPSNFKLNTMCGNEENRKD